MARQGLSHRLRLLLGVLAAFPLALLGLGSGAPAAGAATPSAAWSIRSLAQPTSFAPGDSSGADVYKVLVTNVGSLPMVEGSPVTITDTLPAGVKPVEVAGSGAEVSGFDWETSLQEPTLECSTTPLQCTWNGVVPAGDVLEMNITVATEPSASGPLTNAATVTGGGAAPASTSAQNPVSSTPAPFAISDFSFGVGGLDGQPETQAGGHPYAVTTTLDFNTQSAPEGHGGFLHDPAQSIKDAVVDLPLGLVGNPQSSPRCPLSKLESEASGLVQCPPDTKIGEVSLDEPIGFASSLLPEPGLITYVSSLYNIVPEQGHPAEFGFDYAGVLALLYPSVVHTDAGYVLRVTTPNTPSEFAFFNESGFVGGFSVTLFGDPAKHGGTGEASFFTNPSDCSGSGTTATIHVDTWTRQATMTNADGTPDFNDPNWQTATSTLPPVTGCNALSFDPTLSVQPDTAQADSPTGATVDLKVPQAPGNDAALATPDLKDTTVMLPAGVLVSPSASDGLGACSEAQIGLEGDGEVNNSQPACPESSKLGSVEIDTPLLAEPLEGMVYLATQNENPFGSLIALYIVVDDPATGIVLKIPGEVSLNPVSGQITTTFEQTPQLPFSELKLHLKEGPRAPLTTPQACGSYTTESSLTPWSAPQSGPPAAPSDSFQISTGCGGGFSPSFTAGTSNNQAGAFSPFTLTLARSDADQDLGALTVRTPPGLLGMLSRVQLCQEPQAGKGTCPVASEIGHVTVGAGPGPDPVYVPQAGKPEDPVFLTGPYKGAPFGLSVVVPAEAGPFNLGTVVVRSAITVDPHTAQVTITSDPFPTILQGVPLQVKSVNVIVDREGFMFNPTSCERSSVTGTVVSTQGAQVGVSSPFQAANCANLPFKPSLTISTQAKTSKEDGASLLVKIAAKPGEANVAKTDLQIPLGLPARLQTLNKACLAATFEANPAGCPEGSFIGMVTVRTPVLSAPLTGPVILVSHGGAAFPDVEIVLQGEGVEIVLDGKTDIKKGITYSNFEEVPDAPFSSFEANLGEGSHSIFTTERPGQTNLCAPTKTITSAKKETKKVHGKSKRVTVKVKKTVSATLVVPTKLTAQNGAVLQQSTKIAVTGCPKKPAKQAKTSTKKHKRKH